MNGSRSVLQFEMHVRIGECDSSHCFDTVPHFGLRRLHELPSDRRIEEQVLNFDTCSDWATAGNDLLYVAAKNFKLISCVGIVDTASNRELANL